MFWQFSFFLFPLIQAATLSQSHETRDHAHQVNKRLPGVWHLPSDHKVHDLFERAPPGDGTNYAQVGTPTWSAGFPQSSPDVNQLPKEWVDALNAAVAAGKIPNIPQSTNTPGQNPTYPQGFDPNGPVVCSATYKCRNAGDVWDAPDGHFGISFDDGPLPPSTKLQQFLATNNQTATHFMIGVTILQNSQLFLDAFNSGADIAAHTWTHPYMTTLSNLELVAQFGWTSALIKNSTGGRVPKFWRPPYGDSDNRVRAIAKEVFGLTTVIWNRETLDWSIATGGTTLAKIHDEFQEWSKGPKSPGIIVLEHELTDDCIQSFFDGYAAMKANGWITTSLIDLIDNGDVYQNSKDSESNVTPAGLLANSFTSSSSSGSSSSSKGSSSTSKPSSTPTTNVNQHTSETPKSNSALAWRSGSPQTLLTLLGAFAAAVFFL